MPRCPRRHRSRGRLLALLALLAAMTASGCGRKAPPRPPQLVRPERITNLTARPITGGVRLVWSRPTRTADGSSMPDLDGIKILRAVSEPGLGTADLEFEHIATIHLDDRARFAKLRRMTFVDKTVRPGTVYLYRVVAFTLDGYFSAPSRAARLRWPEAPEH